MFKFVVTQLLNRGWPQVTNALGFETKEQAIDYAVAMVMEQQETDSEENVRHELETDGFYNERRDAEWAVCVNEIDNPAAKPTDDFNPNDWTFERSSGSPGYRNKINGEWMYEEDYLNRCP